MPSKSDKQRRALEAKFGHKWVKAHHFDKAQKGKSKPQARKTGKKKK